MNAEKYAVPVLRISLAAVFLWFGINQLLSPSSWTGYLPQFLYETANPTLFVIGNGILEVVLGTALLLGIFTRICALVLGVHLIGITLAVGYNAIGVRDLGLALATLSLALMKDDTFSLAALWKN